MAKKHYLKTDATLALLNQVHLGGIINECVLEMKKGKAKVEAVDITATIVFISSAAIGSKKLSGEVGLGNVELFKKFLSTIKEPKLNVKLTENRMMVSRKDGRRTLDYLLSQPALIPTRLRMDEDDNNGDPGEAFAAMATTKAELSEGFVKDFSSYIATLKTKIVTIEVGDTDVVFILGPKSEHQFRLSLPLVEESEEEFSLKLNGESLAKILSILEFNEEDDPITIGFGDDVPVIIQSDESLWAVSPSEEVEDD